MRCVRVAPSTDELRAREGSPAMRCADIKAFLASQSMSTLRTPHASHSHDCCHVFLSRHDPSAAASASSRTTHLQPAPDWPSDTPLRRCCPTTSKCPPAASKDAWSSHPYAAPPAQDVPTASECLDASCPGSTPARGTARHHSEPRLRPATYSAAGVDPFATSSLCRCGSGPTPAAVVVDTSAIRRISPSGSGP